MQYNSRATKNIPQKTPPIFCCSLPQCPLIMRQQSFLASTCSFLTYNTKIRTMHGQYARPLWGGRFCTLPNSRTNRRREMRKAVFESSQQGDPKACMQV